jgi:hypothetical protein
VHLFHAVATWRLCVGVGDRPFVVYVASNNNKFSTTKKKKKKTYLGPRRMHLEPLYVRHRCWFSTRQNTSLLGLRSGVRRVLTRAGLDLVSVRVVGAVVVLAIVTYT